MFLHNLWFQSDNNIKHNNWYQASYMISPAPAHFVMSDYATNVIKIIYQL